MWHHAIEETSIGAEEVIPHNQNRHASEHRKAGADEALLVKDRFLAMLSHELRTPLTPALLGIIALQGDPRLSEIQPTIAMIRRNIELQSRLIEELADYATIGQHKMCLRLESIDAHEAVQFVREICLSEITSAGLEVRLDLSAMQSKVIADSLRLQQIMWNLLRNAVRFSDPDSVIIISSTNPSSDQIEILFTDHGIGVESAFLPFIFDSFRQEDSSRHHGNGGLGLGMYIAKGLAEAQNGTLTAASAGRGLGTTFRLRLKTVPPESEQRQ